MKKISSLLLCTALLTTLLTPASAMPWHVMGPRAMGMGGAQVAIAQGPLASYWNPAGLGQLYNTSGLAIPFGLRGEFTGSVLEGANNLHRLQKDCSEGASSCTNSRIQESLNLLGQPGNGALLDFGGGASLKIKRLVVFANNLTYVGLLPSVDYARNTTVTVANNSSSLVTRGGSFTELGIGYAHEIMQTGLIVGGNLKGIIGKVGYNAVNIVTEDPGTGTFKKFRDNTKSSIQPGVDLGLLWDMRETFPVVPMRPRFGFTARNINAPKFKQPDNAVSAGERSKMRLDGQMRAGFALSPFKFWHLALDLDLTENLTLIDGQKSRFVGLGTEINVFNRTWLNIPLRAGIQKNISKDSDSSPAFTAGFGLNFLHVIVDLGAMVSTKRVNLQSEGETKKIPSSVALSGRLAFLFGGKDDGRRRK